MSTLSAPISPQLWTRRLLGANTARDGGVVRCQMRDVGLIVGRHTFEAELRRRFHRAAENTGQ